MSRKGTSRYSGFGKTTHYDSNGKEVGYSQKEGFGKTTHYDSKGKKVGHSYDTGFGKTRHYDAKGKEVGKTYSTRTSSTHYDSKGNQVGHSSGTQYSSSHYSGSCGCYIATCVYGSYDCPEVWTLRRYRDFYLKKYFIGRTFIKFYYTFSPTLVKVFGKLKCIKLIWKMILDKMVAMLNNKGYSDSPYNDQ